MDWSVYLSIFLGIAIIIGIPLGWQIRNIWIRNRNLKDSKGRIWGTFFNPLTSDEENALCRIENKYKVVAPPGHTYKDSKGKEKDIDYYYLVQIAELDGKGNLVVASADASNRRTYKITTRDLWPPGARLSQQVPIERAYWVKGDPRPRNPFRDFLPVNIDKLIQAIVDAEVGQALSTHARMEQESVVRIDEAVTAMAKSNHIIMWVTLGQTLLLLAAAGLLIYVMQGVNSVKSALGV